MVEPANDSVLNRWPSIVPPPFGSGYLPAYTGAIPPAAAFNCAAPFRERLYELVAGGAASATALQLCRPLSGAVMNAPGKALPMPTLPSIVPPPFGSGYARRRASGCRRQPAFNCAAPFRERLYTDGDGYADRLVVLQLCRPLSGAVM